MQITATPFSLSLSLNRRAPAIGFAAQDKKAQKQKAREEKNRRKKHEDGLRRARAVREAREGRQQKLDDMMGLFREKAGETTVTAAQAISLQPGLRKAAGLTAIEKIKRNQQKKGYGPVSSSVHAVGPAEDLAEEPPQGALAAAAFPETPSGPEVLELPTAPTSKKLRRVVCGDIKSPVAALFFRKSALDPREDHASPKDIQDYWAGRLKRLSQRKQPQEPPNYWADYDAILSNGANPG